MRRSFLLLLLLAACSDEEMMPADRSDGSISGQVIRVEDGKPYGPVLIALYELSEFRVEALVETDGDGSFHIEPLAAGHYTPVVYDDKRAMWNLEQPAYEVRENEMTEIELAMAPVDAYPDTGIYLEGTISDRETGNPIPGAAIEMIAALSRASLELFSEWSGRSGPLTQLTDESGAFRLGPIVAFIGDGSVTIPHLRISHPMYGDAVRGPWDRDDFTEIIHFKLDRGVDPGVIRGEVRSLFDNEPQAGLSVSIEWLWGGTSPLKLVPPELLSYTDEAGRFELSNVAFGAYDIRAGLLRDDGWIPLVSHGALWPGEGDTLFLEDSILVSRALVLLQPEAGAELSDFPNFEWTGHPAAARYGLIIERASDGAEFRQLTLETLWTPNIEAEAFLAAGGQFRWNAFALDQALRDISLGELWSEFQLQTP